MDNKSLFIEFLSQWTQKFMVVASVALLITGAKMHFIEPDTAPIKQITQNWLLTPFTNLTI